MFNPEQYPAELGKENLEIMNAEGVFERYDEMAEQYRDGRAGKIARALPMLTLAAFMSAGQVPKNAEAFFGYRTQGIVNVEEKNKETTGNIGAESGGTVVVERRIPVRDLIKKTKREIKRAPGEYRETKQETGGRIDRADKKADRIGHNTEKVGKNVEREIRRIRDQIRKW